MAENDGQASKLDDLLQDWDKAKEGKPSPEIAELSARLGKLEEENKGLREKDEARTAEDEKIAEQKAYAEDIKPVLETLRKDGFKASDEFTERWINAEAVSNKKLAKAWDNRAEDSETFDKMVEELTPKFQEAAKKEAQGILDVKDDLEPDNKGTKGDKSISRATRIARSSNDVANDDYEKVDWAGLSGSDFARMANNVYADMRNGTLKPE